MVRPAFSYVLGGRQLGSFAPKMPWNLQDHYILSEQLQ